ncbi:DNA polymerase-3 subunit epsilon [Chryseobacterium taeanense]|uniref:DNA polymerase-3 subunit epsilon n=1 Tax=Chryseobacterium taeanense TaxID=311334 RepID=A0A1G8FGF0_9FLAO|nr:DNA polymerase-3 subunit epsilon [Chryseobacterium taeanense]
MYQSIAIFSSIFISKKKSISLHLYKHFPVKSYLMFIDTETTSVPKRWDLPYSETANWPSVVQVSWIVCSEDGKEIKREDRYIFEEDLVISEESFKVHGITEEFLRSRGKRRTEVLKALAEDIIKYQPLIVGHFIEFDLHILAADFLRAGLAIPFENSRFYCTMLKSRQYTSGISSRYMRLPELYRYLLSEMAEPSHNARIDAAMTASCFFEIGRRNQLSQKDLEEKHHLIAGKLHFPVLKLT